MIFHSKRDKGHILSRVRKWQNEDGDLIGTTNGVFDILHAGHVLGFVKIKEQVARLVVGVNSDESAKQLEKGSIRPVQGEESRAMVLAALFNVDMVIIFDELDPCEFLKLVRPDVHFKGDDRDMETLPETPIVRGYGGQVRAIQRIGGYSTTKIIQRIAYAACPTIDSCPVRHGVRACGFPDICPPLPSIGQGRRVFTFMEKKAEEELQRLGSVPAEDVAEAILKKAREVNENDD